MTYGGQCVCVCVFVLYICIWRRKSMWVNIDLHWKGHPHSIYTLSTVPALCGVCSSSPLSIPPPPHPPLIPNPTPTPPSRNISAGCRGTICQCAPRTPPHLSATSRRPSPSSFAAAWHVRQQRSYWFLPSHPDDRIPSQVKLRPQCSGQGLNKLCAAWAL